MLPKVERKAVAAACTAKTPEGVIDAILAHRRIAAEALAKLEAEGTVVRTLKGDVIAHPAIKIHADAVKAECDLLKQWNGKTGF